MAWVRIHDGAMTHPKIVGLSDKAFRLWIWGLSYSQQHLTDGQIPAAAIPARIVRAQRDLVTAGLWKAQTAAYQIHDYLQWNDSKDFVLKKRAEAKERMTNTRQRSSRELLRRVGVGEERSTPEGESEGGPSVRSGLVVAHDLGARAAAFVTRYALLYQQHRRGAKLLRSRPTLDWEQACDLVRTWDDARLEKLAVIFLTTDDEWIARTDRGFRVFVSRASWCDDRLREWEAKQARA